MPQPLVRAVQGGDAERVQRLLDEEGDGLDIDLPDRDGRTLVHWAVAVWDADVLRLLLERGADPNRSGPAPMPTPLANAAGGGNLDAVRVLLEAGAGVDHSEGNGTALHTACAYEQEEIAEVLLERGADVNARDADGWTPLFFAARARNVDMVRLLLARGADADARDGEGRTATDVAQQARDEALR